MDEITRDLRSTNPCMSGTSGCVGLQLDRGESPTRLLHSRCPWCRLEIQFRRAEEAEAKVRQYEHDLDIIRAVLKRD